MFTSLSLKKRISKVRVSVSPAVLVVSSTHARTSRRTSPRLRRSSSSNWPHQTPPRVPTTLRTVRAIVSGLIPRPPGAPIVTAANTSPTTTRTISYKGGGPLGPCLISVLPSEHPTPPGPPYALLCLSRSGAGLCPLWLLLDSLRRLSLVCRRLWGGFQLPDRAGLLLIRPCELRDDSVRSSTCLALFGKLLPERGDKLSGAVFGWFCSFGCMFGWSVGT